MKREIKFRGKRTDNGDWVYGDLEYNRKNKSTRIHTYTPDGYYDRQHFVVNDTVGQFTGLLDKHGTEIYEDDFLEIGSLMGLITWHPRGYWCIHTAMKDNVQHHDYNNLGEMLDYAMLKCYDSKVIGNIHGNPELLKEE